MKSKLGSIPELKKFLLTRKKGVTAAAFSVLSGTALLLFIYQPLVTKVGKKSLECVQWETQAGEARKLASSTWGEKKLDLISENGISSVVDRITRKGKEKNVSFLSISPRPIEKREDSSLKILPVELETRSSYQALGIFLGELQELEHVFMTVRHFEVKTDTANPEAVTAEISLNVFLAS